MNHFYTEVMGVNTFVAYTYTPGEESGWDGPGCDPEIIIDKIILHQGTDRIRIDGKDITDDLYETLVELAFKSHESP